MFLKANILFWTLLYNSPFQVVFGSTVRFPSDEAEKHSVAGEEKYLQDTNFHGPHSNILQGPPTNHLQYNVLNQNGGGGAGGRERYFPQSSPTGTHSVPLPTSLPKQQYQVLNQGSVTNQYRKKGIREGYPLKHHYDIGFHQTVPPPSRIQPSSQIPLRTYSPSRIPYRVLSKVGHSSQQKPLFLPKYPSKDSAPINDLRHQSSFFKPRPLSYELQSLENIPANYKVPVMHSSSNNAHIYRKPSTDNNPYRFVQSPHIRETIQQEQYKPEINQNIQLQGSLPQNVQLQASIPQNVQLQGSIPQNIQLQGNIPQNVQLQGSIPQNVQFQGNNPQNIRLNNQVEETLYGKPYVPVNEQINDEPLTIQNEQILQVNQFDKQPFRDYTNQYYSGLEASGSSFDSQWIYSKSLDNIKPSRPINDINDKSWTSSSEWIPIHAPLSVNPGSPSKAVQNDFYYRRAEFQNDQPFITSDYNIRMGHSLDYNNPQYYQPESVVIGKRPDNSEGVVSAVVMVKN